MFWKIVAYFCGRYADALIRYAQRRPYRHLYDSQHGLYMERWWVFNPYEQEDGTRPERSWIQKLLPSVRVHHIMKRDSDRHYHDHPWNARTIILRDFYDEVRPDSSGRVRVVTRRAGDTAKLRYGEYHRITYVPPQGVWTLFITWRYRGVWGFLVDGKKIPWSEYLAARDRGDS